MFLHFLLLSSVYFFTPLCIISRHLIILAFSFWQVSYKSDLSLPLNPRPSGKRPALSVAWCCFFYRLLLLSTKVKNLQSLYHFLDVPAILIKTLLSGMPPTHFMWHFHHVLFTLRHGCISFFDTNNTYMAYQKELSNIWLLAFHLTNYWSKMNETYWAQLEKQGSIHKFLPVGFYYWQISVGQPAAT